MSHYIQGQKQSSSAIETRHFNGVLYATGMKVMVKCPIFEQSSWSGSICWGGKTEWVGGVITGFEANSQSRLLVKCTVPSGAMKGEVMEKLYRYFELSVPSDS
jgi:hypothetical protein